MNLTKNTTAVGLSQAFFWGLQHPLQQNFLVEHAHDIFGIMRVAILSQLVVLPFLLIMVFFLNKRSSIRRLLKAPRYALFILLSSTLSITSFYLYAFSQNELKDSSAIAMLIAVSPIAAYVSLTLVDEPLERIWKSALVSLFSNDVAFHMLLGIIVIIIIYGWNIFDIGLSAWSLLAIFLVPALYNGSYFVTARVFLKRAPPSLQGGGSDFYLTMAAASATFSSALALIFAIAALALNDQSLFLHTTALESIDGYMYIFGAISIGVFSAVIYYWTYFIPNGRNASYWHHFTPVIAVLVAAIFSGGEYGGIKTVVLSGVLVLAILLYRKQRSNGVRETN